eukprot:15151446-Heterocapsa_arctica.AAC.1
MGALPQDNSDVGFRAARVWGYRDIGLDSAFPELSTIQCVPVGSLRWRPALTRPAVFSRSTRICSVFSLIC